MEEQIEKVKNETQKRVAMLKQNKQRINAVENNGQCDEIEQLKEELQVLIRQNQAYVAMYEKKKKNFEAGLMCARDAFTEVMNDLKEICNGIDASVKRSRSVPPRLFDDDKDQDTTNDLEEVDDVLIIDDDSVKEEEKGTEKALSGEEDQEEATERNRTLPVNCDERKPPHSLLMFTTRRMTENKEIHLAEGAQYVLSRKEYVGVGVIPLDCPWYICYFTGRPQAHFVSTPQTGPVLLSLAVISEGQAPPGYSGGVMAIYRSKQFERKMIIPFGLLGKTEKQLGANQLKSVIPIVLQSLDVDPKQSFKLFKKNHLDYDLRSYETSQGGIDYKFGLLYCGKGQTQEAEMYDNSSDDVSAEYQEFMELIGTIIPLQGHKGYRAGLDVNSNTTGEKSLFTTFYSSQVMFHVASMLPHVVEDAQKNRKEEAPWK